MPVRKIANRGNARDITIADTLPYAAALSVLVRDLDGTGISLDPDTFYSEDAIELDNIASSLVYRFISDGDQNILAYEVHDRPYVIYREVAYDGTTLRIFEQDTEFGPYGNEVEYAAYKARRKLVLE